MHPYLYDFLSFVDILKSVSIILVQKNKGPHWLIVRKTKNKQKTQHLKNIFEGKMRVSKWWENFHLWVNYPFNILVGNEIQLFIAH